MKIERLVFDFHGFSIRPYGDFNTAGTPHLEVAREVLSWNGFTQVPGIGRTHKYVPGSAGRLDHIFISGPFEVESSGVVPGWFGTGSDHRPLWAKLRLSGPRLEAWEGFDGLSIWDARTAPESTECKSIQK